MNLLVHDFKHLYTVFILELRVECFIKRKWGFVFDCRSLQIRWFLSDLYTVLAVRRQSPCLLAMTSLDDRWHLLDGKWEMGKSDLGRQEKNKKFSL